MTGRATFDVCRRPERGDTVFTLTLPHVLMLRPTLSSSDRRLLAECDREGATTADKLRGLELIVRRIEEFD